MVRNTKISVQACTESTRTQPFRIAMFAIRIADEGLHDFAQRLSYCHPWGWRVYDLPGEQQGPVAGMDQQIVLHPDSGFQLLRARRPHHCFYEQHEYNIFVNSPAA